MYSLVILYTPKKAQIPEEKYDELDYRMKVLFTRFGSMQLFRNRLFNLPFDTIALPEYDKDGNLEISYNWFEEDEWDRAGYNGRIHDVYSGSVGSDHFQDSLITACTLEGLYVDGPSIVLDELEYADEEDYVALINGIFGTSYGIKNRNPWMFIVEQYDCGQNPDPRKLNRWNLVHKKGWRSRSQIIACTEGFEADCKYIDWLFEDSLQDSGLGNDLRKAKQVLDVYARNSENRETDAARIIEDYEFLIRMLDDEKCAKVFMDQSLRERLNHILKDNDMYEKVYQYFLLLPVEFVKAVSESFDLDFWDLYRLIRSYMEDKYLKNSEDSPVPSVSVQEYFELSDVDMIPYYGLYEDVSLKDETLSEIRKWCTEIKRVQEDFRIPDEPLRWIVEIASRLEEAHPNIMLFETFWEDSIRNLENPEILAVWEYLEYEFLKGNPEYKEEEMKRKLKALYGILGNRKLRKTVLGF